MANESILSGKEILVIEDEWLVASDVKATLEAIGSKVIGPVGSIESAEEAISTEIIRVALVDLNLGGVKAFGLAKELLRKGIPVVVATGYDERVLDGELKNVPVLSKPYSEQALISTLEKALSGQAK